MFARGGGDKYERRCITYMVVDCTHVRFDIGWSRFCFGGVTMSMDTDVGLKFWVFRVLELIGLMILFTCVTIASLALL